jgi:hypothetical protein
VRGATAVLIAAALVMACRRPAGQAPAIDPRLSRCVPEDATAIAGFRPEAMRGLAGAFANDRYVLVAMRGAEIRTLTLGSDGTVRGQEGLSGGPPSPLLAVAQPLAGQYPAWAVVRGGTRLPLEGNLANLNRLLGESELVRMGARFGDRAEVELDAQCPTVAAASDFEGSLRAIAVLMRAADSVQVQRDGLRVHASLAASPESVSRLLH